MSIKMAENIQVTSTEGMDYHYFCKKINSFLPFNNINGAKRRIEALQNENKLIVKMMHDLSNYYKDIIPEPRTVYLTIQEVHSATIYIRWRKKGIRGNQKYLMLESMDGREFLLQQPEGVRNFYNKFNQLTLELNLSFSLRIQEIKRIQKYMNSYYIQTSLSE